MLEKTCGMTEKEGRGEQERHAEGTGAEKQDRKADMQIPRMVMSEREAHLQSQPVHRNFTHALITIPCLSFQSR